MSEAELKRLNAALFKAAKLSNISSPEAADAFMIAAKYVSVIPKK